MATYRQLKRIQNRQTRYNNLDDQLAANLNSANVTATALIPFATNEKLTLEQRAGVKDDLVEHATAFRAFADILDPPV